jgi:hypothetical protein
MVYPEDISKEYLQIWFTPADFKDWKPLLESPLVRDKWVTDDAYALSYPTVADEQARKSAELLFNGVFQERYDDPEVQGGKIALIAANSKTVQKPPNCLDRMTSRFLKQVAYNERVLRAEDEIATINCDIADFFSGMSSSGTITVCINSGPTMKKNEPVIGGQFWQQDNRSMAAVNGVIPGTPNTRESVILAAAVEAVEWTHPIEPRSVEGKRVASRTIIYPAEIPLIEEAMTDFSQNPSEHEDGSHIILEKLIEKCAEYESPPRFIREDSSEITEDPVLSASVPLWMNTAEQISVGGRPLVLENGPDVMHSSDEDSAVEERGDVLTGMYTEGLKAPVILSRSEVARQRAMHDYAVSVGYGKWIDSDAQTSTATSSDVSSSDVPTSDASQTNLWPSRFYTPSGDQSRDQSRRGSPVNSDNEDQEELTEDEKGCLLRARRKSGPAQPPRSSTPVSGIIESVPQKAQPPRPATPVAPASPDPPSPKKGKGKAATKSTAAAPSKGSGQRAATPPAVPEGPHPMTTRQKASRAGSLRDGGGSRATDTRLANGNPSGT